MEQVGVYRYGFNGKENDNEVKGEGNELDFGARIYDPRVGIFLSTDPFEKKFPEESPYGFAGNNPVSFLDYNGLFKISPFFAKRYPTLAKIVKYYLPMLKDNPAVRDAWVKASGYTDLEAGGKAFDEMITYGKGPWISPTRRESEANTDRIPLLSKIFGGEGGGEFDGNNFPDNLIVGYSQIEELETAIKKGDDNAIAEAMFVVTSAIMHESAHYGRFNNGRQRDDDYNIEAGAQFEQFAFGVRFSYRNPGVADAQLQRRNIGVLKETFKKLKGTPTTFGMSPVPNFYNYYGSVKKAPVPAGQPGDKTVTGNNDKETP
ncbi:RHS repeat-associated core domain-containing protein [Chitinophaga sp. 30R24]|uniref:RHS repeat-associated core domain-containing protein n=1 Tax=Chitinophaga sp. 30R24 TaxID=3248838 RepID=UPI003B8FCD45